VRTAWQLRREVATESTTGYRLVHGENDGLPGLVADRYGSSVVLKVYSAAWLPHLDSVVAALHAVDAPTRVVLRLSRAVQAAADTLTDGQVLAGDPLDGPVLFLENGITFEADLVRGQKTGFFLDQRDNRARVERHASGRSVLNVFAYTGGFSVYAARGGARDVTSVDISAPALEAAKRNFRHNQHNPQVRAAQHNCVVGDAFEVIPRMARDGQRFDMVILDPPSFAKSSAEVERALASYVRIVRLGLDVLDRSGMLVAASCSSRITAEAFRDVVLDAAARSHRRLHILEQTGHAPDHPIGFPEGAYLKCIFAESR
jgi:23S rRNA (cytosine1962-C5)-methyltransferase